MNPKPVKLSSHLSSFFDRMAKKQAELIEKYGPDFDKPVGSGFTFNVAEQAVINEWLESLKPELLAKQQEAGVDASLMNGEVYYGATGGGLTYSFIPTSLGTILVVKESMSGKELNVTDALDWFFYG